MKSELKNSLLEAFKLDIEQTGCAWRVFRSDTFIDLLMQKSLKFEKSVLTRGDCVEIIFLASKAIINWELTPTKTRGNLEVIVKLIEEEIPEINRTFEKVLISSIERIQYLKIENSAYMELNYFKVISNIEISNYDKTVFENILDRFIYEIEILN